jgi:SagB-type dehydrogenase family enzyme
LGGGSISLEQALQRRRTAREFSSEPLSMEQISKLLWAAQGVTDPSGRRTAPSAGATIPLELYLVTHEGFFHYVPADHGLRPVTVEDLRRELCAVALEQEFILEAPATIVFTAVFNRTEQRYGRVRSPRYIHIEVGHAAQNILLQAVALDLGAVPVGAYEDERVQQVLSLPPDHVPLYMVTVGHLR